MTSTASATACGFPGIHAYAPSFRMCMQANRVTARLLSSKGLRRRCCAAERDYAGDDSRRSWYEKPQRQKKSTAGLRQPRHRGVAPAWREPDLFLIRVA